MSQWTLEDNSMDKCETTEGAENQPALGRLTVADIDLNSTYNQTIWEYIRQGEFIDMHPHGIDAHLFRMRWSTVRRDGAETRNGVMVICLMYGV